MHSHIFDRFLMFISEVLERIIINCDDSIQEDQQSQLARLQHSPALLLHRLAQENPLRNRPKSSVGLKNHHSYQRCQQILLII